MPNSVETANRWLNLLKEQAIPNHDALIQQIAAGKITHICECGCHGFDFEVADFASLAQLKEGSGLFCELAFESNYPEEIDILLFTDKRGFLNRVDVTYGAANSGDMPDDIMPTILKCVWPAAT